MKSNMAAGRTRIDRAPPPGYAESMSSVPLLQALRIWVLADDRPGNVGQCLGVAEALALPFETKHLAYTAAAALPNFFLGATFAGLTADSRVNLTPPWPDLVIAAGRRTTPVARHIKALNSGRTFIVQIMHPGAGGTDDLDLIANGRHLKVAAAPNLLPTLGWPHRVRPERLAEAADTWQPRFAHLPKPWIALIVGGGTKRRDFTPTLAAELGRACNTLAHDAGGSLLITTSRRTGEAQAEALLAEIAVPRYLFRWGDTGDNPYFGYLALADLVVVTGDSSSMCCEACGAGRGVYIYAPPGFVARKHADLHAELYRQGAAKPFAARYAAWTHSPVNCAVDIAAEIKRRLGLS